MWVACAFVLDAVSHCPMYLDSGHTEQVETKSFHEDDGFDEGTSYLPCGAAAAEGAHSVTAVLIPLDYHGPNGRRIIKDNVRQATQID